MCFITSTCLFVVACNRVSGLTDVAPSPSMREILNRHLGVATSGHLPLRGVRDIPKQPHQNQPVDVRHKLFPRLYNPDMMMWIHPHLDGEVFVPGYVVTFPMYQQVHSVLPDDNLR